MNLPTLFLHFWELNMNEMFVYLTFKQEQVYSCQMNLNVRVTQIQTVMNKLKNIHFKINVMSALMSSLI